MSDDAPNDPIYIADLAELLQRSTNTIRQWMGRNDFPSECMPHREDGRGKLYWLEDQVSGIRAYAQAREAARGWGGYHRRQQASA